METNVKEIDVKTNAYNAGRLYAIYEANFKESGARMNQFIKYNRICRSYKRHGRSGSWEKCIQQIRKIPLRSL